MAKANTYSVDPKEVQTGGRKRWWMEPAETVALALTQYCASLEEGQQRERYCRMVFEQMATGRAPINSGIAMQGRVKGDMATALFSPPSENYIAIAVDVFNNKIGKNRPFLQWIPLAKDDTDVRAGCRQAEDYCDQIFEDLKTWPLVAQSFKDATIHGTGPIFVDGIKGNGKANGTVTVTRLQDDEILLDPTAGDSPPNFQIRLFMNRWAAINKYASGKDKESVELAARLADAPACVQGFYHLDIGYQDTVALCIGFWLPLGQKGRKVVAIGDVLLENIEFEGDLPIAKIVFEPIADSWKGQGCVEMMLPLQREVDRIADNLSEQERRFCWAKWGFGRGENIDEDQLIGNSNVEFNEVAPKVLDTPEPPDKLYDQLEKKGQQCLARVGISQNQTQGTPEPGVNAGVAIIAAQQIDDVRHVAVAQRLEDGVEMLGKLIIQACKRYNPTVYSSGKVLSWPTIVDDQRKCKSRAFKMSGLPQSIPGRKQAIADMLQNGEIDKLTYRRALGHLDVRKEEDFISVTDDFIDFQLDGMLETGEFDAPIVFIDVNRALERSQKRLLQETMNGLPRKKLQLIAQYAAMCAEKAAQVNAEMPQNATPQPGATPAPDQGTANAA
jgi:hypothetical protein